MRDETRLERAELKHERPAHVAVEGRAVAPRAREGLRSDRARPDRARSCLRCELGPVRMARIRFHRARIQDTTFKDRELYSADFAGAVLLKCVFEGYEHATVSLSRTDWTGAAAVRRRLQAREPLRREPARRGARALRPARREPVQRRPHRRALRRLRDHRRRPRRSHVLGDRSMPSRPDLREIASNVRDAFADMDRETLLDILTFVLKEYVVEGPPPMLDPPGRDAGRSQGRLVRAADQRAADAVRSSRARDVRRRWRAGQRAGRRRRPAAARPRQPLTPRRGAPAPSAAPRPGSASSRPRCSSGHRSRRRPSRQPQQGSAPPPTRGVSLRGRPRRGGSRRRRRRACGAAHRRRRTRAGAAAPPARGQPAAPAPPAPTSPRASGDDASARFSLLELD